MSGIGCGDIVVQFNPPTASGVQWVVESWKAKISKIIGDLSPFASILQASP
jgi:hypothetical protein